MLENGTFSDDAVAEVANKKFVPVSLDGGMGATKVVERKYGVRGYPTVLFLNPNEEEIKSFVGYGDPLRDPGAAKKELETIYNDYAKDAASVRWVESIDEAKEASEGKLIFVFFQDDKKGTRLMEKHTLSNLNVLKLLGGDFICVKVDFDRKSELSKEYRIYSAPAMLVIDKDGRKVSSIGGAKKPKEAIHFLNKAVKTFQKKQQKSAY